MWNSFSAGQKFDPEEYYHAAADVSDRQLADVFEGNMSCGNIKVGNDYKAIVCYDIPAFQEGVRAVRLGARRCKKSIKLTPTTERRFLIRNVEICIEEGIDYIVMANTVPNSYLEKPDGTQAITMGLGGLGGRGLIPIVTGMLRISAPVVKGTKTKLIAAGGVEFGRDAYHYLKHGAHGFVFSTLLWKNNFDPTVGQKVVLGDESQGKPGLLDYLVQYGLPD